MAERRGGGSRWEDVANRKARRFICAASPHAQPRSLRARPAFQIFVMWTILS